MSKPATLKTWKATKAWADTDVDADYMWLSDRAAAVKAWAQSEPVTEARAVLTVCATGVWLWLLDVAAAAKAWAQSEPVTEAREVMRVCAVGLWLWLTDSLSALRAAATSEETAEYWAEVNALRKRQLDVSAVLDGAAAARARALASRGGGWRRRCATRCSPRCPPPPAAREHRGLRALRARGAALAADTRAALGGRGAPRGPRRPSPPSAWRRATLAARDSSRRGARRRQPGRRRRRDVLRVCAVGLWLWWPRRSAR